MELRQLRYFTVVAEEGNITRAAARLHIAQPPLGRQLTQLEEEVGVSLLDRKTRPITLTPAGRTFLSHAQEVLAKIQELDAAVRQARDAARPVLRIGFDPTMLYGVFPEIMRGLRAAESVTDFRVLEVAQPDQAARLLDDEADICFGRAVIADPRLDSQVLRREALALAMPRDHALADRPAIQLGDLGGETLILFPKPPTPGFSDQVLELLQRHGVAPTELQHADSLQTALGLVAAQIGVCIIPTTVQRARAADVHYAPIDTPDALSPVVVSRKLGGVCVGMQMLARILTQIYATKGWPITPFLSDILAEHCPPVGAPQ
jgi:LysR family transcriptional regulator, benzoate and cis,cis-muconate-responsive activator of ben and cat genes